jgi:hypothetical protein
MVIETYVFMSKGKGKAIPLQALTGPEGSRSLRLPDFNSFGTWRWQDCQPYAPAAFTPRKYSLVLISFRGWIDPRAIVRPEGLYQWKKSSDSIGNRTRDLPVCSAVPQPCPYVWHWENCCVLTFARKMIGAQRHVFCHRFIHHFLWQLFHVASATYVYYDSVDNARNLIKQTNTALLRD